MEWHEIASTSFFKAHSTCRNKTSFTFSLFGSAPCRKGAENPGDNMETKILPPYSRFFSPVGQAISCLKANIKANITRPEILGQFNDRQAARNAHLLLGEYRKQILTAAAKKYHLLQSLNVWLGLDSCKHICQNASNESVMTVSRRFQKPVQMLSINDILLCFNFFLSSHCSFKKS